MSHDSVPRTTGEGSEIDVMHSIVADPRVRVSRDFASETHTVNV